jgi:CRP/FNR family transcriptional regulator, anaerobic regulatory protein
LNCYYKQIYQPALFRNTMTQNLIQFIKYLVPFNDNEIQEIHHLFVEKTLKKGEFWIKEGEFNSDILFVNKGMLRSYFVKEEVEKTFDLVIENQIVTATECYSSGLPSTDCIQAVEDSQLSIISKDNLEILYANSPKWERVGRIIFEAYTLEQEIRIRSFIAETAQERYERLAKDQPELIQRTPQIYLANFLGITPQSLSRLRRKIVNK